MIDYVQNIWNRQSFMASRAWVIAACTTLLVASFFLVKPAQSLFGAIDLAMQGGVNRKLPKVEAPSQNITFSETPKDEEFLYVRNFFQPLVPSGRTSREENRDLAKAVTAFENKVRLNKTTEDVSDLTAFLQRYPRSTWRPSLLLNLGMNYRQNGQHSKTKPALQQAWALSKNLNDPHGRAIGDMSVAQLSQFLAYLGRKEELASLLAEIKTRDIHGSAAELVSSSSRGYNAMLNAPGISFRCGPLALLRIVLHTKPKNSSHALKVLSESYSTANGLSLTMVQRMSVNAGMNYQMAFRPRGAKVVTPAVMHWKMGHYAAIVATEGGNYIVKDSTFGETITISQKTLEEETSGYFLIPDGPLPQGWRAVRIHEGDKVWGRGNTGVARDEGAGGSTGPQSFSENSCTGHCTTWNVEPMTVSLSLRDRPVRYTPPIGPAINFDVYYSHRDVLQPQTFNYSNLGAKWTLNWISYVEDNIRSGWFAELYQRGGGNEVFTTASSNATTSFVSPFSQSVMTRTLDSLGLTTSFKRWLKDGSTETYGLALGTRFFLTEIADPQGNKVTLTYDSKYRVVGITDAIGQVSTLSYEHSDPLKITKITDPFGRSATFTYTASGQLASVTDMVGITSSYLYGTGDFVKTLTTPYGTSNFKYGDSTTDAALGFSRFLEATDGLGRTSRVEFKQGTDGSTIIDNDPLGAPTGMPAYNYYLQWRNTFIWNPEQYKAATASGKLDYSKAKNIHWLHRWTVTGTSRIPESIKEPGENRVWYVYVGSRAVIHPYYSVFEGTTDSPTQIGRVLSPSSTQLETFDYNDYGLVTQYTDPMGRTTRYSYAANQIDLIGIANTTGGLTRTLASITYNSQHLPLSVTSANGATTNFEYNSVGQLTKTTDALGHATTYSYNANRYLTGIQGPLAGSTYSFTYDTAGRVASATDPTGATVTYAYDNADRPTKVTFPDGTSSKFAYTLLDLTSTTDRLGQTTQMVYDAERQLIKITDPANQITQFAYTLSGKLASITDPNGHITSTARDIQDRVISKTYADNTTQSLTYDPATSRITTAKDALGQVTSYAYNVDDSLSSITYTNAPKVNFTYDAAYLRPLTMVDGIGTTTYDYYASGVLGANQLKSVISPVAGTTNVFNAVSYGYDALGRVTGRNLDGATQTTTYDALGRTTNVTNGLDSFNYTYSDATARVTGVNSAKGPKIDLSYYGPTGDLLLKQMKYTAGGKTLSQFDYEFNANDNVTKFTQSYLDQKFAGLAALPGFDDQAHGQNGGGLIRAALAAVNVKTVMLSKTQELVTSLLLVSGILLGLGWGALFASRKWRSAFMIPPILAMTLLSGCGGGGGGGDNGGGSSGGGSSSSSSSSSSSAPTATAQVTNYAYDKADRLVSASVGTDIAPAIAPQYVYDYDPASNLTGITANAAKQTLAYTATNAITTGTYDANGSPTKLDGATYVWDGANRLIGYSSGLNSSEFVYDGLSRLVRIVEKAAGLVTSDKSYGWCGAQRCLEHDNTKPNSPISKQYFAQGEIQGATPLYYVTDRLGSVRQLVSDTGSVVAQYDYDPYGNRKTIYNLKDSDFGFTGLFHHTQSGLDFALYRAYDPIHARWLNRDPIGEAGGLNLYGYVGGNSTNFTDPLGLQIYSGQTPPPEIPGGPWTPAGPGQPSGTFYGPKNPEGGQRLTCRYVPDGKNGGPKGAPESYWKTKAYNEKDWNRYNKNGQPISAEEAHPGKLPSRPWLPPLPLFLSTFLGTLLYSEPAY